MPRHPRAVTPFAGIRPATVSTAAVRGDRLLMKVETHNTRRDLAVPGPATGSVGCIRDAGATSGARTQGWAGGSASRPASPLSSPVSDLGRPARTARPSPSCSLPIGAASFTTLSAARHPRIRRSFGSTSHAGRSALRGYHTLMSAAFSQIRAYTSRAPVVAGRASSCSAVRPSDRPSASAPRLRWRRCELRDLDFASVSAAPGDPAPAQEGSMLRVDGQDNPVL